MDADFNVRIADFGLSKIKASEQEFLTTAKVGTPFYMAPEILCPTLVVKPSPASDVYSYAIMINEILDERTPYTGVLKEFTLKTLTDAVGGGEEAGKNRPRLPVSNAQVPQLFTSFICECWALDPEKRPTFSKMCGAETPWDKAAEKRSASSETKYKKLFELFKDDKKDVTFKQFAKALSSALDLEGQLNILTPGHYLTRGLQAMMCVENIGTSVTRDVVERFVQWFGGEQQVLPYIYSICCKKWFFGAIDLNSARDILSRPINKEPGTFLVRWDLGWRITWIDKKDKAVVADEPVSATLLLDKQQVSKLIPAVDNFIKERKLKNPAVGRALLISGVEMKDNFITGGSSGCYSTDPVATGDGGSTVDAPVSPSKHYNFLL